MKIDIKEASQSFEQQSRRENVIDFASKEPLSIEQIIMAQLDEPIQKNCIFKLQSKRKKNNSAQVNEKFY